MTDEFSYESKIRRNKIAMKIVLVLGITGLILIPLAYYYIWPPIVGFFCGLFGVLWHRKIRSETTEVKNNLAHFLVAAALLINVMVLVFFIFCIAAMSLLLN